jgi:uncharacterized protein
MKTEGPWELGVGIVYSPLLARVLDLALVDVLEIEPQVFWHSTGDPVAPVRVDFDIFAELRAMPQHKLVHSVSLPVGNSRPHDPRALELLRQSIAALDAPYASEHLSFNQFEDSNSSRWTSFLLPPVQTEESVENAASRIDEMRCAVGVPVAFETGVNYLRPQPDELSDGLFLRKVAEAADCGILLDLHNLLTNERNGRGSLKAVLSEIPLERVWEIHLAGGMEYRGYWLDSHSSRIEDELFSVTAELVGQCPNLRAMVFEIMDEYIDQRSGAALRDDVRRLRCLWNERVLSGVVGIQEPSRPASSPSSAPAGLRRREATLGALVLGRPPRDPEPRVASDPGAALYADLVAALREGTLYKAVPFLIRLLLVSIGHPATMEVIGTFGRHRPPEPFGADEAQHFISYVRELDLPVRHLGEILDLEDALLAVGRTPDKREQRIVPFDCDATALLCALAETRDPGPLARESCTVEVSAAGVVRIYSDNAAQPGSSMQRQIT